MVVSVGQTVMTRWGLSKIEKIELCEKEGDKYGVQISEVFEDLVDRCVFDFKEGWQYGSQLDFVSV
jgi:uncharacterized protein (UPF0335 family)